MKIWAFKTTQWIHVANLDLPVKSAHRNRKFMVFTCIFNLLNKRPKQRTIEPTLEKVADERVGRTTWLKYFSVRAIIWNGYCPLTF